MSLTDFISKNETTLNVAIAIMIIVSFYLIYSGSPNNVANILLILSVLISFGIIYTRLEKSNTNIGSKDPTEKLAAFVIRTAKQEGNKNETIAAKQEEVKNEIIGRGLPSVFPIYEQPTSEQEQNAAYDEDNRKNEY